MYVFSIPSHASRSLSISHRGPLSPLKGIVHSKWAFHPFISLHMLVQAGGASLAAGLESNYTTPGPS